MGAGDEYFRITSARFSLQDGDIVLLSTDGIFSRGALGSDIGIAANGNIVTKAGKPSPNVGIVPHGNLRGRDIISSDWSQVVDIFNRHGDDIDGAVNAVIDLYLRRIGNADADNAGLIAYLHKP